MAAPTAFTTPPTISGGGTRISWPNYTASDGTKQKCYWSRGNGWAFVALARTMDVLPTNDPHYAEYLQTFQEMAAALKAVQRPDGFWNVNLAYTNDYPGPESSGTACFTYGLAWGINHGYLDTNTYLPAVINGWNALANGALHHSAGADNGFLGYEQGSGSKPSDSQPVTYTSVPDFDDFGLGLFLLAGSQVYQLSSTPGITLAAPVLTAIRCNSTSPSSAALPTPRSTCSRPANWATAGPRIRPPRWQPMSPAFRIVSRPRTMSPPGSTESRLPRDQTSSTLWRWQQACRAKHDLEKPARLK